MKYKQLQETINERNYNNIKGLKAKITKKKYDYLLNVLPPLKFDGNVFYMREFYTGNLTLKCWKEEDGFFCEVVDFRKEFPNLSNKEYNLLRF